MSIVEKTAPRFLGADLSLNHGGFVLLDKRGKFLDAYYVAETLASVKVGGPIRSRRFKRPTKMTRERWNIIRLSAWSEFFDYLFGHAEPAFIGLEDYAYQAESNTAYQYGEASGVFRLRAWDKRIALRFHEPLSVKLFSVGKGNAKPPMLLDVLQPGLRKLFVKYSGSGKNRQTAEDLATAYWLARMVWVEHELRVGRVLMSDFLPHQIRVFNRVTKRYPENLLSRDWIQQ